MNKHATQKFVEENTIINLGEIEDINTFFNEDKYRYPGIYSYTVTDDDGVKNTQLAVINGTYENPEQYFINLRKGVIAYRRWILDDECWENEFHGLDDVWEYAEWLGNGYKLGDEAFTYEHKEAILQNNTDVANLNTAVEKLENVLSSRASLYAHIVGLVQFNYGYYSGTQSTSKIISCDGTPRLVIIRQVDTEKSRVLILSPGNGPFNTHTLEFNDDGTITTYKVRAHLHAGTIDLTSYDDNGIGCMNGDGEYDYLIIGESE